MAATNTIPVGATSIPKYATWNEHRESLHREADANREKRLAARTAR